MIRSKRGIFKRAPASPIDGTLTLDDDTEKTIIDVGTINGPAAYRIQTAVIDVVLGSHASVTVRAKADVGDTLQTVDEHTYNSAQTAGIFADLNPDRLTSQRVAITIQGTATDPTTNGTVELSVSFLRAY